jgi:PKD repeat protein
MIRRLNLSILTILFFSSLVAKASTSYDGTWYWEDHSITWGSGGECRGGYGTLIVQNGNISSGTVYSDWGYSMTATGTVSETGRVSGYARGGGEAIYASGQVTGNTMTFISASIQGCNAGGTFTRTSTPNQPPTASFTMTPSSGNAPLTVRIDGSMSTDSDGSISRYAWTSNGQSKSGRTSSFTFNSAGTYSVSLTVYDNDGSTSSSRKTISVNGPPPSGNVDSYAPTYIQGWSFDADNSATALSMHIYIDGQMAGSTTADIHRPDLASLGLSNNNHGFRFELPNTLADGDHNIDIYAINIGQGSNMRIGTGLITTNNSPKGSVGSLNNGIVNGWTYDPNDTLLPINIHVYADGEFIESATANINRPDLSSLGIDDTNHGFSYEVPSDLLTGRHTISFYAINVGGGLNKQIGTIEVAGTSDQSTLGTPTNISTGQAMYTPASAIMSIPAVDVTTSLGTTTYTCEMTFIPFSDPMRFQVDARSLVVTTAGDEVSHSVYSNGILFIPAVEIERDVSQMELRLINDNPIIFEMIDLTIIE